MYTQWSTAEGNTRKNIFQTTFVKHSVITTIYFKIFINYGKISEPQIVN